MPDIDTLPKCQACGACCFGHSPRYVPVSGDDHQRLGSEARRLTQFVGTRCFMRITAEHCAALSYDPAKRQFWCQVYDNRPQVCRDLLRGSPECKTEHAAKVLQAKKLVDQTSDSGDHCGQDS